jgi:formyltetrahydrofolate synthetase
MGIEKFCNIKCRSGGLKPSCGVLVATVRALKVHGGGSPVVAGQPLPEEYTTENIELLDRGCENLRKQIENIAVFGIPVVVCIPHGFGDSDAEMELLQRRAMEFGAFAAVTADYYGQGGVGTTELAEAVVEACEQPSDFQFLYDLESPIEDKIETICKRIYGAAGIEILPKAREQIERYKRQGFNDLPICMAKTQYSLSHDPALKGAPTGFTVPIREVRASIGAGFLFPVLGEMSTMPGLGTRPAFYDIDINVETGEVIGLF